MEPRLQQIPRPHWLAIVLPMAIACAVFWPVLSGGFLSDDFLLGHFLDQADGEVRWHSVFADFARPWLGQSGERYRPMLSLSYAVDLATIGANAAAMHFTNLGLHLVVVVATSLLCALHCPARPTLAALLGGTLVAVHPVAVESVAWVSGRSGGLECALRTMSLTLFAYALRHPCRVLMSASLLCAAMAFATYETAVILPVSIIALDLLQSRHRPWRQRWRYLLPFVVLTACYFGLRLLLFGHLVGARTVPIDEIVTNIATKAQLLFAAVPLWGAAVPVGLALYALAAGWRRRAVLVVVAGWWLLHLVPGWNVKTFGDAIGARTVYGAAPVVAVGIAALVLQGARAWLPAALFALLAVVHAGTTRGQLGNYQIAWRDLAAARAAFADLTAPDDAQPPALLAMPLAPPGTPPLHSTYWFAIAQRPFAARDTEIAGCGYVFDDVPGSESMLHDPSGVRALWRAGSAILSWRAGSFLVQRRAAQRPGLALRSAGGGHHVFEAGPVSPLEVDQLVVRVPGSDTTGGVLRWLSPAGLDAEARSLPLGQGRSDGDSTVFHVDLTHHLGLLALAVLGVPLNGFELLLDGAPAAPGASVAARGRLPGLSLPRRLGGAVHSWQAFGALVAPAARARSGPMRVVLLGPHSAFAWPVTPGTAIGVPDGTREILEQVARAAHQRSHYYFFEQVPGARSALDWFRAKR